VSKEIPAVKNWILVVEDDADTRESLIDALTESGFAALGASGTAEAFKLIVDHSPALVFSDIDLGDDNGVQLLDLAMKTLGPVAPAFVFLTGVPPWQITGLPRSSLVLKKPIHLDRLVDVAGRYCPRQLSAPTPT
jgi:DNA-binding LytR/AlgR family response regulator